MGDREVAYATLRQRVRALRRDVENDKIGGPEAFTEVLDLLLELAEVADLLLELAEVAEGVAPGSSR